MQLTQTSVAYSTLTILGLIILLHSSSLFFGWYEQGIQIDIPQHVLAGVLFGVIWLWLLQRSAPPYLPLSLTAISIVSFAALVGVAWEVFEFAIWQLLPSVSENLAFRSSTITDLLGDISSSVGGSSIVAIYHSIKR